ncbi:SMI1/KNR4 family protein [Streptomyces sp. 8L]|uniref:SMI1/KNR4 family protein n=1 Tax=Streptomyces sp. 8L TaxID=2877242 RepID=UPI001CD5C959|nr:SMI1/KNR4 family protein [Streptomyces sp. 8L]MCA1220962.1 SMI1/KNR4 family protein [Streptomyces sp. 8L]
MKIYNWRPFLDRWRADESAARGAAGEGPGAEAAGAAAWELGFPPADEARVAALEERLEAALPPSFRSFLAASDGWRPLGTGIELLGTSDGVEWRAGAVPAALREAAAQDHAPEEQSPPTGARDRVLRLTAESDLSEVLLDPGDVDGSGEWAAHLYRGGSGETPERYDSFLDLMQELFRTAQRRWSDRFGAAYVSETTRELDAETEEARLALLAGEDIDTWLPALSDAAEHGRPRARVLYAQVEALLDPDSTSSYAAVEWVGAAAPVPDGPLLVREFLPLAAWAAARDTEDAHDDVSSCRPTAAETAADEDGSPIREQARAAAVLRAVRERTYRYEAGGGRFGKAVETAREQARWGDAEGAWDTLIAALPSWQAYGTEQVAPVGLLADPVLGPLITAERGRQMLETPRPGHGGDARGDAVADVDTDARLETGGGSPDGLDWLADEDPHHRFGYRFLCVEGVEPAELAERWGGGPLPVPYGASDLSQSRSTGGPRPVRLGRAGRGWSFAFDGAPHGDFASGLPGAASGAAVASGSVASMAGEIGRVVSVWVERSRGTAEAGDVFHFSCSQGGEELYGGQEPHGFTWRAGGISQWGETPEALDPGVLFQGRDRTLEPDDECEALLAIGSAFGISLPRFALTRGRLAATVPAAWPLSPAQGGSHLEAVR